MTPHAANIIAFILVIITGLVLVLSSTKWNNPDNNFVTFKRGIGWTVAFSDKPLLITNEPYTPKKRRKKPCPPLKKRRRNAAPQSKRTRKAASSRRS